MEAIILHKLGKRIGEIQRGLRNESIILFSKTWDINRKIDYEMLNASAILLYVQSPDTDILEGIPELRSKRHLLPIIVFDEIQNEETRKRSIELSADAYYAKPFRFRKIGLELKNMIYKRTVNDEERWLRAYDLWLDMENHFAKRKHHLIPLRNKEFSLLEFFIINKGKVLTRNDILDHVWDRNANFASNTVDVHINRLRKKIDDPFKEKLIHTIHCIGYMFDKKNAIV